MHKFSQLEVGETEFEPRLSGYRIHVPNHDEMLLKSFPESLTNRNIPK